MAELTGLAKDDTKRVARSLAVDPEPVLEVGVRPGDVAVEGHGDVCDDSAHGSVDRARCRKSSEPVRRSAISPSRVADTSALAVAETTYGPGTVAATRCTSSSIEER